MSRAKYGSPRSRMFPKRISSGFPSRLLRWLPPPFLNPVVDNAPIGSDNGDLMINQLPHTLNEASAEEGDEEFSIIIASINLLHLRELALTTRRKLYNDLLPETSCVVSNPPRMGSFNIVASYYPRLPCQYPVFTTGPSIPTTFSHARLSLWTSCREQISQSFGTTKTGLQASSGKEYSSRSQGG
ncbi:hypothetical protein L208DRAFT_480038 [Tricholoma matsutake]|nr:hypothetical protein L208DRAFT_480038 [Tricholoma matsutake 945]